MNRRQLLAGLPAAGVIVAASTSVPLDNRQPRVSCETGDPGERLYGMLCGDGKKVRVYLDGVEQAGAITADPVRGFVKRYITTPKGNFAINHMTNEVLTETVHGKVHWDAVDAWWLKPLRKA